MRMINSQNLPITKQNNPSEAPHLKLNSPLRSQPFSKPMSCGIPDDLRALRFTKQKTGKTKDVMGSESESTDNYMDNQCNACWWLKSGENTSWGWEFLPIILRSFIHPTACRISEPSTVVNSVQWHTGQSLAFFWLWAHLDPNSNAWFVQENFWVMALCAKCWEHGVCMRCT